MKFKFSYEKLLSHKRTLEEIAQKNFAEAQHRLDDAKKDLEDLYQAVDDVRARAFDLERKGGASQLVGTTTDEFVNGQKIRIEMQKTVVREKMWDVEHRQEELLQAVREKKTLEKLREKKLAEFKQELKRKELKEVDDLVTMRFHKKGSTLTG